MNELVRQLADNFIGTKFCLVNHCNRSSEGYYVSTMGANKSAVAKYIREQENEDMVMDQLSFKEYEDPFKK